MRYFLLAAISGLVVTASTLSNITSTTVSTIQSSQSCECSVTRIERLCPRRMDDVRRCNCIERALRSCSSDCPESGPARQLSCQITSNTTSIRVASAAISASNIHAHSTILAPATNLRLAADPRRPSAIQCGGNRHSPCPRNQICSTDTKTGTGFCTGAPCFLGASRSGRGNNELCPSSPSLGNGYRQICVQKPRKDSRVLTDLPGLCADPDMKCGGAFGGCPRGWSCQGPNGDGDVCQGDPGCQGLCMHIGDGRN